MNILNTFLQLTSKTYPYGFETELERYLPKEIQKDKWGNYFLKIGESKTIFASHLDTACKDQVDVQHRIQGNIIKTDGKSVLGADDKAGVVVLLYLIEKKIPGLYYFFIGEEVGCIGSGDASTDVEFFKNYDRIISFDRRGTDSVITYQSSLRCCSEGFAESLSKELNKRGLNFKPDNTGVYTDSAEFTSVIPECTNISVGYYKEHTYAEHQDIEHLRKLCRAAAMVNWENLPTIRNINSKEYIYNHPHKKSKKVNDDRWDEYYDSRYGDGQRPRTRRSKKKMKVWKNPDYKPKSYFNDLEHEVVGGKIKKLDPLVDYSKKDDFLTKSYSSTFSLSHQTNYLKPLKPIIFNEKLNDKELNILAEQYFDLTDEQDLDFYDYLKKSFSYRESYL
jgi:hypothetical protein